MFNFLTCSRIYWNGGRRKSSTVAKGYINESLHHKQEIHKKITKSIALKTINDGITDKNIYQIKSSSESQIIIRGHQPKPSIATTSFKNVNLESADENRQPNVYDGFLYNEFSSLTSTQNAICGSPSKKRNKTKTEESFSVKNDNGNISFVTINIHNHNN